MQSLRCLVESPLVFLRVVCLVSHGGGDNPVRVDNISFDERVVPVVDERKHETERLSLVGAASYLEAIGEELVD
jgi:hypothetical protein